MSKCIRSLDSVIVTLTYFSVFVPRSTLISFQSFSFAMFFFDAEALDVSSIIPSLSL